MIKISGFDKLITQVYPKTKTTKDNLSGFNLQLVVITIAFTVSMGFFFVKIKPKLGLSNLKVTPKQEAIISNIFQSRTSLFYYLLGQKSFKEQGTEVPIPKSVPQDLFRFKFLLHPMRLTMMKLLYENLEMTSIDLKELLDASWNDIGTHITALKDKGYISSMHQFLEGSRKNVVVIEPLGIENFKVLLDLLHLFLDNTEEFELYPNK